MHTLTFILGMERFNAHLWHAVEQALHDDGIAVRIHRFNDDHLQRRDPALVAAIAESDLLFVTLVNMRAEADWLRAQIEAHQPQTVFVFESMPEAMALTRVGDYRIEGGKGSMPAPMKAVLRLITRGRDEDTLYAYTKLTKLTRKLLPLMPAKLGDFRTWLSVNVYWNQPDVANLTQMIRLILRDCFGETLEVKAAQLIPMMGCFHPASESFFAKPRDYLRWAFRTRYHKDQPLVALLAFRKHVVQQQDYLDEMIVALEREGLAVLPLFVSGIETHVAVREWIASFPVELLISTMGFPIVGGPAGTTKPGQYQHQASDLLAGLDVPYMVAQPLQMQSDVAWRAEGVAPMQAIIMYDLPEMDGSVAPVALGAIRDERIVAEPDRLARAARQAAAWVRLRRKARHERRIAFVLYNYPPGLGKLGTAALLDVPASLHTILRRLQEGGYRVEGLPPSPERLTARLNALEGGAGQNGHHKDHVTLYTEAYYDLLPRDHERRVDDFWGQAPGDIAPAAHNGLRLDGFELGNIFVGVQPPMGVPGDPMRLLFDQNFTPHHQYVAFYRWLTEIWGADAIVHVGMHGTAEWMPGLQLGLTRDCWPDLLLGELPNLYLYPMNNPAESAIARRRGYASIISHAVPPYARAGLYKQLAQAQGLVADDGGERSDRVAALQTLLPDLPQAEDEAAESYLARVRDYLAELEARLIVDGLHIFGQAPDASRSMALIEAALDVPRDGHAGLTMLLAQAGVSAPAAARRTLIERVLLDHQSGDRLWRELTGQPAPEALEALLAHGRAMLNGIAQSQGEVEALLHALDGGYTRPLAGADPVRAGAAAFPSGRNIHGIDAWRLPTNDALRRGREMAVALIDRHRQAQGDYPETVAMTLWALDTIKSEGESLGAILALVGATPERDGQGKIWRYALTPLDQLGRPRIDILLDISAIFRDTFQHTLDLLDDLFRRAADADEPVAMNPIRAHALALKSEGQSWEAATARIFSQSRGHYGTGVDELIEESQWEDAEDLTNVYLHRGAHSYGGSRAGQAAPDVLRGLLSTVGHVFQAIDSVEYGLSDMQHYYGHSGALQLAASQARGDAVPLTYAEAYTGTVKAASAAELLQIEARTKLLNPRWYEGMMAHGHAGAAEIGNRFTYLLGWSAVSDLVQPWLFDEAAATFVLDEAMRQRLEQANPQAARNAVSRLLEANGRGLWPTDDATIDQLQSLYTDLEDRLEGVARAPVPA
ncbi:MAG: magnesium chelatase subunit H [Anaerolineales bacterium]|nr:magnesium chelatase subunit H [Anaerolineales bacterium]MCB9127108.1 magnesium chelatase subunit H [Ardenticatenales bacterium]